MTPAGFGLKNWQLLNIPVILGWTGPNKYPMAYTNYHRKINNNLYAHHMSGNLHTPQIPFIL